MKARIFVALALLFGAVAICGQTVTPNIGLQIPNINQNNWWVQADYDYQLLDVLLSGNKPIPGLHITNNLIVDGTITGNFSGFYPSTPGVVYNTSSSASRNATSIDFSAILSGASGCNIAGTVYSPISNTCIVASGSGGTVTYTTSTTASVSDNGKLVVMNCPSACVYTLPATQPSAIWNTKLATTNSNATVALGGSDTYNGSSAVPVLNPYRIMGINANSAVSTDYRGEAPLVAGSGCSFTSASNGLTISCSSGSGVTLQSNGVNNASQATLNLQDGNGTHVTNPSGGNVQISTGPAANTVYVFAGDSINIDDLLILSPQIPIASWSCTSGTCTFTTAALTLSSVAAASGGSTVYSGTITNGASNAFAGVTFIIAGFVGSTNNGTFLCTASTGSTLTLKNASGTAETHAATATFEHGLAATNWVNLLHVTSWPGLSASFFQTGQQLLQVSATGLTTTQFTVAYAGTASCASSCGTIASAMGYFPFQTTSSQGFPTQAVSNTAIMLPSASIAGVASTYVASFHPISPAVTGHPAYLILLDYHNDLYGSAYSCVGTPASIEASYASVMTAAHADGWKVVVGAMIRGFNIGCHSTQLAVNNWLASRGETPANAPGGVYWDAYIDIEGALKDGDNTNIVAGNGQFEPGGARIAGSVAANAILTGGGQINSKWSFYFDNGYILTPTQDEQWAFDVQNAAGTDQFQIDTHFSAIQSYLTHYFSAPTVGSASNWMLMVDKISHASGNPYNSSDVQIGDETFTPVSDTNQNNIWASIGMLSPGSLTGRGSPTSNLGYDWGFNYASSTTLSLNTAWAKIRDDGADFFHGAEGGRLCVGLSSLNTVWTSLHFGQQGCPGTAMFGVGPGANFGVSPNGVVTSQLEQTQSVQASGGSNVSYGNYYAPGTMVQAKAANATTPTGATVSVTLSSAVTAGNILVVTQGNNSNSVAAPTDTLGLTWTLIRTDSSIYGFQWTYIATVSSGGTETITYSPSAHVYLSLAAMELHGVSTTVDQATGGVFNSTTPQYTVTPSAQAFVYSSLYAYTGGATFLAGPCCTMAASATLVGGDQTIATFYAPLQGATLALPVFNISTVASGTATVIAFDLAPSVGHVNADQHSFSGDTTIVSSLGTCNSGVQGKTKAVTDATAPTFLGTLTGGGSVYTPVVCNGTAWVSY